MSEIFFIVVRTGEDMIKVYIGLHAKYSLFLSDFNETRIFPPMFRRMLRYKI